MNQTDPNESPDPDRPPSYASLRDYVRVLQRHRLLIAVVTILFGGLALGYSLTQSERYAASAALSFRDPLADLGLIGVDSQPEDAPQTRAAANAELITRDAVAERAREVLERDGVSPTAATVSGQVSPQTNLVVVTAEADSGERAAATANAYAVAARQIGSQDIRERVERAEDSVLDELKRARKNDEASPLELQTLQTRLAAIAAFRTIAQPVEIAQRANVPGSPVSPKPLRNTAIGLLVGLLLGVLAAFGRDSLDRRFRAVHEIHRELDLPILGRIPEEAFAYPGLVSTGGAVMGEGEFEPFRVLRMNLGYLSPKAPPTSILVTSGMPEEGKTMVSISLAGAAALAGGRVLLIETDLRRPSFTRRMELPPGPGLADFLRGEAAAEDVVRTIPVARPWRLNEVPGERAAEPADGAHFACVTAGNRPGDAVERLGSSVFSQLIATVSQAYDLVLLDGSPMLAVVDPLALMPMVDAALICVRMRRSTTDEARSIVSALGNLPELSTGIVVTGLSRGGPDAYEYYYGY